MAKVTVRHVGPGRYVVDCDVCGQVHYAQYRKARDGARERARDHRAWHTCRYCADARANGLYPTLPTTAMSAATLTIHTCAWTPMSWGWVGYCETCRVLWPCSALGDGDG